MSRILLIALSLVFSGFALADTIDRDMQNVNDHLQFTDTKLHIQRQGAAVQNEKSAPALDSSPTYDDWAHFKSYGVEMRQSSPFDDLDLDPMREPDPDSN